MNVPFYIQVAETIRRRILKPESEVITSEPGGAFHRFIDALEKEITDSDEYLLSGGQVFL